MEFWTPLSQTETLSSHLSSGINFSHWLMGTKLLMSTTFHPQMDGATKWANCSIRQILHYVVRDNQKDWAFKLSAPSFRVGSTTLREFPLPSVKKQMAASTYKTLMSSCGWRKLAPQSTVLPLKSRLINLFSIPHQWKNLISYYKISQLAGDNLQGSIWGSFLVNSHKALMIPLEELAQWLAATAGLTLNCMWWVKEYVQQSLYGQIHNAAAKIGQ